MNISAPIRLSPDDPDLLDRLAAWKGAAGVYVLQIQGANPHLASTAHLGRRLKRLLLSAAGEASTLLSRLRGRVVSVDCWPTGSRLESSLLLYALARDLFPDRYLQVLRLRPPWFVGMADLAGYPRLESTSRLPAPGAQFGPFLTRAAAQRYEQEVAGLFQIRRCPESLLPHPEHPGCIYGEMNQCLRPCQLAVSRQEYLTEAARVEELLRSNGKAVLATLASVRERACEEMEFEQAAQAHRRMDRIQAAGALRDPVIQEAARFRGLALTRAAGDRTVALWPMLDGYWQAPVFLELPAEDSRSKSLDSELREILLERLASCSAQGDRLEHLALFSRWYYSSWRDGEWFPFGDVSRLNYRKLVRGISKMVGKPL